MSVKNLLQTTLAIFLFVTLFFIPQNIAQANQITTIQPSILEFQAAERESFISSSEELETISATKNEDIQANCIALAEDGNTSVKEVAEVEDEEQRCIYKDNQCTQVCQGPDDNCKILYTRRGRNGCRPCIQ